MFGLPLEIFGSFLCFSTADFNTLAKTTAKIRDLWNFQDLRKVAVPTWWN